MTALADFWELKYVDHVTITIGLWFSLHTGSPWLLCKNDNRQICHLYTVQVTISIYIKRSWAERWFTKSSCEQWHINIKLSQITDAAPDLNLRGAKCTKKPLPRSVRRKTSERLSAILDLRRKYTVFHACSYAANTKEEPLSANSSCERPSYPFVASYTHLIIKWYRCAKISCCRGECNET